ncbi:carbohydrate kinase [candidate division MSBL1 archaeon SCGC-AAA382A20]|uniref:Carbohydrate kinase n=1 Tax=candidate division MSBL1 archaeon SCGC-AAA382A20 TaxID=1698280 RepID=A0A133VKL6_9EURY|nr:carbohydrate kinase [candidate division MSBL1 archaeon SCGC-AAA382A20]
MKDIKTFFNKIRNVKVAVYGDYALDAYWILDPQGSEISRETGLQAEAVAKHYYTLGGASNVVSNVVALKPAQVRCVGILGDDVFGRELGRRLNELGVETDGLIVQRENFDTVTFVKRYVNDEEQPRIDFGFNNQRTKETDEKILGQLESCLKECDVLIFNQQVPGSLDSEFFIKGAKALFDKYDEKPVLLDSRHYAHRFNNVFRKTNAVEAAVLNDVDAEPGDVIELTDVRGYGKNLYEKSGRPVFITRGERGLLVFDDDGTHEVPGIQLMCKLDTVGAGDTATSALAAGLAAGASPKSAAEFANFAAAVTVQEMFTTGTASPEEILEIADSPDFIYQPELAEDSRKAAYLNESAIEMCYPGPKLPIGDFKHAVFDNDGTISVLREGWETVMQKMMVKSILGEEYESADEKLYLQVLRRVRDYIEKSTGIQTILQMEHLVDMVSEFGIVSEDEIKTKYEYKDIYNKALLEMVNGRIEGLKNGRFDVTDFVVKGALQFLTKIRDRGLTLYLASGTDREDVVNEGKMLGYADMFDGGIYGAVGDVSEYSKRQVLEDIVQGNNLAGEELLVVGDGPVEMRESRRVGGFALGVASNEIRRYGLNQEKRSRLIKAGAHVIAPDFSWQNKLIDLLFHSS